MNLRFLAATLLAVVALSAYAEVNVEDRFSFANDTFVGYNMNYRVTENGDSTNVVVIYLHGGSGQGTDNREQMKSPAIADIYFFLKENIEGFTFIVPQVPHGQQWDGIVVGALKELLDKYSDNGNKDLYILGGSMGGAGTWNMLTAYPGFFKGAMPVAINTPAVKADNYIGTKIFSVIGGSDRRRNIGKCQSFFKQLIKHGGTAKLDVKNRWGHRQTCEWSFTPERLAWLFNE